MPDPQKLTLSATQVPGLFNQSPYCTRWMLYHWARGAMDLDVPENTRMTWGKKLQDVILTGAAEKLRLEIRPNHGEEYRRHADSAIRIGYTADGDIYDPSLGIGAVEAKNVDGLVFKREWSDEWAPPHIELQLQTQIMVLESIHGRCDWGIIPALVGGNELKIYRRAPNKEQQQLIAHEVAEFWMDVEQSREPDPFGSPREVPGLKQLYAETIPGKVVDVMTDEAAEIVDAYQRHKEAAKENAKLADAYRVKLLAMAQDAQYLNVPGCEVTVSKVKIKARTQEVSEHTQTRLKFREVDLLMTG